RSNRDWSSDVCSSDLERGSGIGTGRLDGGVDVQAFHAAVEAARADSRPSFIRLSTVIAWPAPNAQNTGGAHGAALGEDEVRATKSGRASCREGRERTD